LGDIYIYYHYPVRLLSEYYHIGLALGVSRQNALEKVILLK